LNEPGKAPCLLLFRWNLKGDLDVIEPDSIGLVGRGEEWSNSRPPDDFGVKPVDSGAVGIEKKPRNGKRL